MGVRSTERRRGRRKRGSLDEAHLIERLQRRDERAFRVFVETYQRPVFNLVYRMLGDAEEARDLSQEVFVSAFRGILRFRGEAKLSTWLFRIATNHCRNRQKYLGRRQHGRQESYDELGDRSDRAPLLGERPPRPDRELAGQRLERGIQDAIRSLSPDFRELIVLRDVQGLSYEEMTRVTGLAAGTVKSRLHRARLALKNELAPLLER